MRALCKALALVALGACIGVAVTACVTKTVYVFPDGTRSDSPAASMPRLVVTFRPAAGIAATDAVSLQGEWRLERRDSRDVRGLMVEFATVDKTVAGASWDDRQLWNRLVDPANAPIVRPLSNGTLTFVRTGGDDRTTTGTVTFDVDAQAAKATAEAIGQAVTAVELLRVGLSDLTPTEITKYRAAEILDINGMIRLRAFRIDPAYAAAWHDTGHRLGVDGLIRANSFRVKPETAIAWKKAGYDFSLDNLIRANSFRLDPAIAAAWRTAGYKLSLDELIRTNSFHLDPADAAIWTKGGYDLSLDQLIRANSFRIDPTWAAVVKKAGYDWSLDDLIRANSFHVDADELKALADAGYAFSLDEVIKLKSNRVSAAFAASLCNPAMENLSAEEIVRIKQRGMDEAIIRRIRGASATTQSAQH